MANELQNKKCIPCEGGIPPLPEAEYQKLLPQVSGWQVRPMTQHGVSMDTLQKRMTFEDFRSAMAFLRRVEDLAESEGHHPDFCVHYNSIDFTLFTHAIRGLHENDFILAAKINALENE